MHICATEKYLTMWQEKKEHLGPQFHKTCHQRKIPDIMTYPRANHKPEFSVASINYCNCQWHFIKQQEPVRLFLVKLYAFQVIGQICVAKLWTYA